MSNDEYNSYMREIRSVYRLDPQYRAEQAAISKENRDEEKKNPKQHSQEWITHHRLLKRKHSQDYRDRLSKISYITL